MRKRQAEQRAFAVADDGDDIDTVSIGGIKAARVERGAESRGGACGVGGAHEADDDERRRMSLTTQRIQTVTPDKALRVLVSVLALRITTIESEPWRPSATQPDDR